MVAGGCIIVMEITYKMDFSLVGFLFCCSLLSLGMCPRNFGFMMAPFFFFPER